MFTRANAQKSLYLPIARLLVTTSSSYNKKVDLYITHMHANMQQVQHTEMAQVERTENSQTQLCRAYIYSWTPPQCNIFFK